MTKKTRLEKLPSLTEAEKLISAKLRAHVVMLAGMIGARSLTDCPEGLDRAGKYIEQVFSEMSHRRSQQDFMCDVPRSPYAPATILGVADRVCTRNFIAELKGTKYTQDVIILGAHYDAVANCPGANDNGSGVAAMLELARLLQNFESERTIRFVAFANEEQPFFGTDGWGAKQYAELCRERKENIVAMVSLETMGYFTDQPGTQSFPHDVMGLVFPKQGDYITFVSNIQSRRLLNRFTQLFKGATQFPCEKVALPESVRGVAYSDHAAFWNLGYPAIMATDTAFFRYPQYHTAEDTPDRLNYDHIARVVSGMAAVVKQLANGKV
ncbi:MAG TPA: M20/M25/M40 family metallo-hydrolase [Drouetiella sp.]